jgi:pimeloyl-ACP methyl ester carboxylesterase
LPVDRAAPLVVLRQGETLELAPRAVPMPLEQLPVGRIELDEVEWGQHRLRAIWTLPEAPGPHPVIWFLPGATWLTDERCLPPGGSLLELVRGFTRAGFATLRVDRSGLGDSEGPPCTELDLDAELAGWQAVLSHLSRRATVVRRGDVFVYGRSLGGMVAALLAQEYPFRGVAVWGTSARPWAECMLEASRRQYTLSGLGGARLETKLAQLERLQHLLYHEGLTPEGAFEREPELKGLESDAFRGARIYLRTARFFQQLARLDLAAAWRAVRCPVLALHGSADFIGFAEHSAQIARLAPEGRYLELPGMDHMMHVRANMAQAFAEPFAGTFTPAALDALLAFYRERLTP